MTVTLRTKTEMRALLKPVLSQELLGEEGGDDEFFRKLKALGELSDLAKQGGSQVESNIVLSALNFARMSRPMKDLLAVFVIDKDCERLWQEHLEIMAHN